MGSIWQFPAPKIGQTFFTLSALPTTRSPTTKLDNRLSKQFQRDNFTFLDRIGIEETVAHFIVSIRPAFRENSSSISLDGLTRPESNTRWLSPYSSEQQPAPEQICRDAAPKRIQLESCAGTAPANKSSLGLHYTDEVSCLCSGRRCHPIIMARC